MCVTYLQYDEIHASHGSPIRQCLSPMKRSERVKTKLNNLFFSLVYFVELLETEKKSVFRINSVLFRAVDHSIVLLVVGFSRFVQWLVVLVTLVLFFFLYLYLSFQMFL